MKKKTAVPSLEERFLKVYCGLSKKERRGLVLVFEYGDFREPVTWNVICSKVLARTELGDKMLKKLEDLGRI